MTVPSVVFLDGDKGEKADPGSRVFVLPGESDPEAHIFDVVLSKLDTQVLKLTAALNLPADQQNRVKTVVRETGVTNHDRHIIFRQLGEQLDPTAELMVANAFIGLCAQLRPTEISDLMSPVQPLLPMKGR